MNYQWQTAIEKLMIWRSNNWVSYETSTTVGKLTLRIHYDQLMIVSVTKVLETFNMTSRMKGVYKDDVLILIICCPGQEARKLKLKIMLNADQCYLKLGAHFPVISHNRNPSMNKVQVKYRSVDEVFRLAINNYESITAPPANYVDFVKLCLMDPTFPQMVRQTQLIIQEHIV